MRQPHQPIPKSRLTSDDRVSEPDTQDLKPYGRGRKLWRAVVSAYDLRADEAELLAETCRLADLLDDLRDVVADEGFVLNGKAHPALVELRNARLEFQRHLSQLGLPDIEPEEEPARPEAGGQWLDPGPDVADIRAHRHNPRRGRQSRRAAARGEQ